MEPCVKQQSLNAERFSPSLLNTCSDGRWTGRMCQEKSKPSTLGSTIGKAHNQLEELGDNFMKEGPLSYFCLVGLVWGFFFGGGW